MAATVTQLAARALRRLGVAAVAASDRPGSGSVSSSTVATRALQMLGIAIPASERPPLTAVVTQIDIASHALQLLGLSVPAALRQTFSSTGAASGIATRVLQILEVISAEQTPDAADLSLATGAVTNLYDRQTELGIITFPITAIPSAFAEDFAHLAALDLASTFGRVPDPAARERLEAQFRRSVLVGQSQTMAESATASVHESLVAQGVASWGGAAIPRSMREDYAAVVAARLAPAFAVQQAADALAVAEARLKRAALVSRGQTMAQDEVAAVHDALVAQGSASWISANIPQGVADEYARAVAARLAPAFGVESDPKAVDAAEARVRRVAMLLQSQAMAEEAVMGVHANLSAVGKVRWTCFDFPDWVEEPMVVLAANHLAPSFDRPVDVAAGEIAAKNLLRGIALGASNEPVRAEYF